MRASFRIRLDDESRVPELERLIGRAGGASVAHDDSVFASLLFPEPCTDEQAYDEVAFALRALLPESSFQIERI